MTWDSGTKRRSNRPLVGVILAGLVGGSAMVLADAAAQTKSELPPIDYKQGTSFSPGVRGQCPYRQISVSGIETVWDLAMSSSGRGLAGGLDADTYDWRNVNSGANWGLGGGYFTTLQFLQFARDHNSWPMLTANMFGGGYKDPADGTFVCQTDNPDGLAADWVRYTNVILQNYRQGDEGLLAGEDLRVFNSIADWLGRARLLAPGESGVPKVQYWEIGNEPEVPGIGTFLRDHYLGPTAYRDRYKQMAQAMLAVDPTLKLGPCLCNPSDPGGSGQWLAALADDPTIPINFVAYHPYYNLKAYWGNPSGMTGSLRAYKAYLAGKTEGIRTLMSQHGRSGYELMASEWNPMNWDATSQQQKSVAQGLGVIEAVFTFAELNVLAAHFWEQPQDKLAVRDVFTGLADYMGDVLVSNVQSLGLDPGNLNWRIYVTKRAGDDDTLIIWGLNFNEDQAVDVELELAPCYATSAVLRRYGIPGDDVHGGDTSLMHYSGMAWTEQDVTDGFDTRGFTFSMEDAEVTALVLDIVRVPRVDYDRDGDVDQSDFGVFQACLSGVSVPQTDPACRDARLDGDSDVDPSDFFIFLNCMSGAGVPADPDCAN